MKPKKKAEKKPKKPYLAWLRETAKSHPDPKARLLAEASLETQEK